MIKSVFTDKVWIPLQHVQKADLPEIKEAFTDRIYNEAGCKRCELRSDRHTDQCDECPNFRGTYKSYGLKTSKEGVKFLGLPQGNRKLVKHFLPKGCKIVDKRVKTPFKYKIKFTKELFPYQQGPCDEMVKKKYGILEAPPRSGKTPMSLYIACKIGYKTLIIANQKDYLVQFYETIYGSEENEVPAFTNLPKLESKYKTKIAGFAKKLEDFKKYDIVLCTYQTFISEKGQALLKKVSKLFGTVILDEAHKSGAECFIKVMSKFQAAARIGLTGTYDRKDGKIVLVKRILGPSTAKVSVETLKPLVTLHETTYVPKKAFHFVTKMKNMLNDKKRMNMLVDMVLKDYKKGRSILIPAPYVKTLKTLEKMICERLPVNEVNTVAVFDGKSDRDTIRNKAISGEIRIVLGVRSMVQTGLNIPRWDTLYVYTPISNTPNFTQETARIRTKMEGKSQPIIRFFLDDCPISRGCFRTSWYHTVVAQKFEMSEKTKIKAEQYLKGGKRNKSPFLSYVKRTP